MMATHAFDTFNDNGTPTAATVIVGGRSAATFVVVARVSLAFISGGRTAVHGRHRTAGAAGVAVRAVLIGMIGLALGFTQLDQLNVILPFYALPLLLGLSPRVLVGIGAALIALGRSCWSRRPMRGFPTGAPTPTRPSLYPRARSARAARPAAHHGAYPVVVYLAYLCAGLAIGRLDLNSRRLACWLLGGGLGLAATARIVSAVLLYPLGGLARLITQSVAQGNPASAAQLLWEPDQGSSW